MLTIVVRYFAVLREQKGREEERVQVPEGATPASVYQALVPVGPAGRLPVAYAVNHSYAAADQPLREGDELALLPPIGGG